MDKYLVVLDVIRGADESSTPTALAARVRKLQPQGKYDAVRICEDIGHIIRRDGQFTKETAGTTRRDSRHAMQLKASFERRHLWKMRK